MCGVLPPQPSPVLEHNPINTSVRRRAAASWRAWRGRWGVEYSSRQEQQEQERHRSFMQEQEDLGWPVTDTGERAGGRGGLHSEVPAPGGPHRPTGRCGHGGSPAGGPRDVKRSWSGAAARSVSHGSCASAGSWRRRGGISRSVTNWRGGTARSGTGWSGAVDGGWCLWRITIATQLRQSAMVVHHPSSRLLTIAG